MTDINAAAVRPEYFVEQVKRYGPYEAAKRYIVRDSKTLRALNFKEKLKLAGVQFHD